MLKTEEIKEIDLTNLKIIEIDNIVENTINTWQKERTEKEKALDTSLGKLAEVSFEFYLKNNLKNVDFLSYDNIRTDEFLKHAPFDFLLFNKNINKVLLQTFINKITEEVKNNKFGKISDELKLNLSKNKIYITEMKSTRINVARHYKDNKICLNNILLDDFLEYPKYLRISEDNKIKDFDTYSKYVFDKYKINKEKLLNLEFANLKHIYIRCYIDELENKAYLIGYLTKDVFRKTFNIKQMKKQGKSEFALYLFSNLKEGKDIDNLNYI